MGGSSSSRNCCRCTSLAYGRRERCCHADALAAITTSSSGPLAAALAVSATQPACTQPALAKPTLATRTLTT